MTKINAAFLANGHLRHNLPKEWLEYARALSEKNLWKHYFLWQAYQVLELLGEKKIEELKVLEPGSGGGVIGCLLSMMGADVTFLDYDEGPLAQSRACARSLGVEARVKLVKADLFSMPLPAQSYDLVWNDGVIEHFPDPMAVIRTMAQMAKPGGSVLVTTPNKWTPHTFLVRPWRRLTHFYPHDQWGREKSFSERDLARMLRTAGLANVRASTHHLRRTLVDDYFILSKWENHFTRGVLTRFVNITDALEAHVPFVSKMGFMSGAIGEVISSSPAAH